MHSGSLLIVTDILIGLVLCIMVWRKSWPSSQGIHDLTAMLNTKGGIILLLWITSMIFFMVGMRMIYWGVNHMLEGKLSTDNALILSAFNWITGSAFGGAFGAMIKTMTGEDPKRTTSTEVTVSKSDTAS